MTHEAVKRGWVRLAAVPEAERPQVLAQLSAELAAAERPGEVPAPDGWGRVLEQWQSRAERRAGGSFYTPLPLAARGVEILLENFLRTRGAAGDLAWYRDGNTAATGARRRRLIGLFGGLRILDPAAGAGDFLVAAARRIAALEKRLAADLTPEWAGIELNEAALIVARARLERERAGRGDGFEWRCEDALTAAPPAPADWVVGNPPFVSLRALSAQARANYREAFRFATGRFNLFGLFIEATARRWLKPGALALLILPDRLLRNTQLAELQRFLAVEQQLLECDEPPPGSFRAAVDCVTLCWRNRPGGAGANYRFRSGRRWVAAKNWPAGVWTPPASGGGKTVRLGEIAAIRDGIIQSRIGAELFRDAPVTPECRKLLVGRDVMAGRIEFHSRWVDYRPAAMRELEAARGGRGLRLRTPEIFERPKILTRQTADRIIAACDTAGEYYYANTLHGMTLTTAEFDLAWLCWYLNTPELNQIYQARSGEAGRVFAQVKISMLRELPIPLWSMDRQKSVLAAAHGLPVGVR